jgi:hypothetical protein
MLLLSHNPERKMQSFEIRKNTLAIASHLERTTNPDGYIKRKKIQVTPLLNDYREAIRPLLKTECIASAEAKADAIVSAAHEWPTLETLRAESIASMRREFYL